MISLDSSTVLASPRSSRDTVLACYGGAGFDPDLSIPGDRVLTVGLDDL